MNKKVKTTLRIDYKAMKYYNMYNLIYRRHFNIFYVAITVLCFAGAALNFIGFIPAVNKKPDLLLGIIFIIFALYFIYQLLNLEKIIDRNISQYFHNRNVIEQEMEIDEENIIIRSKDDPTKVVSYEWIHVTQIHEINQFYFLYLGKQPLIISKDPNDIIEGTYEDLVEILNEKIKGKPYKKITKEIVKKPITFVHQVFEEEKEELENAVTLDKSEYEEVKADEEKVEENTAEVKEEDAVEIPVEVEEEKKDL